MSNETYHVLGASIRAARLELGNGTIIMLRKQKRGKTHTIRAIARENNPQVLKIPPGTETSIYEFLTKTESLVYYIDDKDRWSKEEFYTGLRYGKGLSDGEKAPLKATHFTAESIKEPESTPAWFWIVLNKDQFDFVSASIYSTGLGARAIYLRSKHTDEETKRIRAAYKRNKWNNKSLPLFKKYDDWYYTGIRLLSEKEEKIIDTTFPPDVRSEIEKIAQVMSEKGFKAVLEFLQVSCAGQYWNETIEFEEHGEKRKNETEDEWIDRMEKEGN